jgi:hypothetical protein
VVTITEFRLIHSFFLAVLGQQFERPVPIPDAVQKILETTDAEAELQPLTETAVAWLDLLGAAISPFQLRQYGQQNGLDQEAARALLRFWASRRKRSIQELDKVDWLATAFFRVREEESKQPVGWVKGEVQELLKGIPFPKLGHDAQSFLGELPPLLDDVRYLGTFSQIVDSRIPERGREFKAQIREDFCNPLALAAVVNYNVVLGNKFEELRDRAILQVRESAPAVTVHELQDALQNDYRSNAGAIHQLADLTRKEVAEKGEVQTAGNSDILLDQQLVRLGIDSTRELSKLRSRIRELAKKMMEDAHVRSIRICGSPLSLDGWEADSLRALTGRREENLQGAFARSVSRAIAFLVRIYEELYAYETKKGAGNVEWMKHHAALFYLLYEGRQHQAVLQQLALLHRKGGFPDLAQQLASTADKLEANLGRLKDLF